MKSAPTLTLTPDGASDHQWAEGRGRLVPLGEFELHGLDAALRGYSGARNKLVNVSADLLAFCGVLSRLAPGEELGTTRTELARSIVDLKYAAVARDYPPSVAENLCLLFAIAIDEFIMASNWGRQIGWENRTLVADLFGFRDGGERFYKIADRALLQPKALHEFLEILYVFLKLGFRGKYPPGAERERDRLIARLEAALDLAPASPTPDCVGRAAEASKPPRSYVPAQTKLAFVFATIIISFLGTWFLRSERESVLYGSFVERRAVAAAESDVDHVFSSQDGRLEVRPRQ